METENKNTKMSTKSWVWTIVGVIVVIVLVLWVRHMSNSVVVNTNNTGTNPVDQTALTSTGTEDLTTGDVNAPAVTGGKAVSLSYTEALAKYANARLQLDTTCQALASPSNLVFKNNSMLMVDNRAPVARTVHIGSVFSIKAYGFKIIELSSAKLPATLLVDCGTAQNVATITIEK